MKALDFSGKDNLSGNGEEVLEMNGAADAAGQMMKYGEEWTRHDQCDGIEDGESKLRWASRK